MISQETIREVQERVNILEIVGEGCSLKRQGSSYVALCPFHSERSPSFHVREAEKHYHCFGCGESGTAIDFLMKTKGLSFPDAIEELAQRYGIIIKRENGTAARVPPERELQDVLLKINMTAWNYFRQSLHDADPRVRAYVTERRLQNPALTAYGIGFAPAVWRGLSDLLKAKGFSEEHIILSGLARRNDRGDLYDLFRGRLIFPILLDQKRIAAFGGRLIPAFAEGEMPKYINSPETALYSKSKVLYGIPQALTTIREEKFLYLVEGYMDVVGLWQVGVRNALATCGTAFATGHLKRLRALAPRCVVLFDGDSAGRAAAGKCFPLFLNSGIDAAALFLPEEDDPDSLALRLGTKTADHLKNLPRTSLLTCHIELLARKFGAQSIQELGPTAKGQLANDLAQELRRVENSVELGEYVERASETLHIGRGDLTQLIAAAHRRAASQAPIHVPEEPNLEAAQKILSNSLHANAAQDQDRQEEAVQPVPIRSLPRVDQDLLSAVMSVKELVDESLRDSDVASGLHPCTLYFLGRLQHLLQSVQGEQAQKTVVLELLREFGPSWVLFWRSSYEMSLDKGSNMRELFAQSRRALKRGKVEETIERLELEMSTTTDEPQRVKLSQHKVDLLRRIRELQ